MNTPFTPGTFSPKGSYIPTSAERTAYQAARIPWAEQVKYGYYTLYFLASILVVYSLLNGLWYLRIRSNLRLSIPGYSKLVASGRYVTYPRLPPNPFVDNIWTFGPLGPNILLLCGLLFVSGFTWINKYYYYPPFYGSAPLYLRSEWIAMATLPFLIVLGSKRNLISLITGVSHEKLQVLHQGAAFNFLYMSLVHTIAACIRAYPEYGIPGVFKYNPIYTSGFVALAPLLFLFAGALPSFRKWGYEAFYWLHMIMALFFLGALFWHGYNLLDNDAYMIATISLFLFSVVWRVFLIAFNNPMLHTAQASITEDGAIHLSIPTLLTWKAGQHVFLRFISVRPLESHPFTITSLPSLPSSKIGTGEGYSSGMKFILRPQQGFTRVLHKYLERRGSKELGVLIDGPYGESGRELGAFDKVLILVGGTGATWGVGMLQEVVRTGKQGQEVRMVWAARHSDCLKWFEEELDSIRSSRPDINITLQLTRDTSYTQQEQEHSGLGTPPTAQFVDSPNEILAAESSAVETEIKEMIGNPKPNKTEGVELILGRPDLRSIIHAEVSTTRGSMAVACCGPAHFLSDTSNAVAGAQKDILVGKGGGVKEVYLRTEAFGW